MELLRVRFDNGGPASPLRHAARDALTQDLPECPDDAIEDVLLVISELVQNVTQHTGSDGELVVRVVDGGVLIEVHDDDPREPHLRHPDGRRIGGRGLLLVEGMADHWGVRLQESGKTVWAQLPAVTDGSVTAGRS